MALRLQFTFTEGAALEAIVMDATPSEGHSYAADVTDYPTEGTDVSDNVRDKPIQLRFDCFVSDFPLLNSIKNISAGRFTQKPSDEKKRSLNVLGKLIDMKSKAVLISVSTGIRHYENMVISNIEVSRDKAIKDGVRFNLSLREIKVVQTQTVQIVAKEAKGQNKKKDGPKTAKKAAEPEAIKASLAAQIWDGF